MTHSRQLRVGGAVGGLVARLSSSVALAARWAGSRPSSRRARAVQAAQDEALFAVHVEQALQIVGQVQAPRIVSVTDAHLRPMARR